MSEIKIFEQWKRYKGFIIKPGFAYWLSSDGCESVTSGFIHRHRMLIFRYKEGCWSSIYVPIGEEELEVISALQQWQEKSEQVIIVG